MNMWYIIGADIIQSAFVIAHNAADTDQDIYLDHKIICRGVDEYQHDGRTRPQPNNVLETDFLTKRLQDFDDLVRQLMNLYCGMHPSSSISTSTTSTRCGAVRPDAPELIRTLAKEAALLTVATEPSYVIHCAVEPGVTW